MGGRYISVMTKRFLVDVEGELISITESQGRLYVMDKPLQVSMVELSPDVYSLLICGQSYLVHVKHGQNPSLTINGKTIASQIVSDRSELIQLYGGHTGAKETAKELRAPMPGLITKVLVQAGDTVAKGQGMVVLEAMKMENELLAPCSGRILQVHVKQTESVVPDALLIEFE